MMKVEPEITSSGTMKAWQLNSFGKEFSTQLQLNDQVPIPEIKKPCDVLIRVKAASINPIDCYMVRGYGAKPIQITREQYKGRGVVSILFNNGKQFPIILGRDIAGIVEKVGKDVTTFKVGDEVYGVVEASVNGSHAEYAVVEQTWIQLKPEFLSFNEAASIPFVAMTTWSALRNAGNFTDYTGKNFLVLGGSGGVGTIAIQYLKSKGAKVTTTCGESSFSLMTELGADFVIDYKMKKDEFEAAVASHGPYDCIYDLAGGLEFSRNLVQYGRRGSSFISLNFPIVHNFDNYGLFCGALKTGFQYLGVNISTKFRHGVGVKWAMFSTNAKGLQEIAELVRDKKIKPIIDQVYTFAQLTEAYERVDKGHLRGKIVVQVMADD